MDIPKDLRRFGLVAPSVPRRRRLVMTSEGGPGVGKTDLFFRSFPRPALFIDLDLNGDGVTEHYASDDVLIKRIEVPTKHDKNRDREIFDELVSLYEVSVTKDLFRSVCIDEGSALYTLCRRAFLDGLDFGDAPQKDYSAINSRMSKFFTLAKQLRFNFYLPMRQKKERKRVMSQSGRWGSEETGQMTYAGWGSALYESQCHLLLLKNEQFNKKGKRISKFEAHIQKCSAMEKLEGMVIYDDDISLPNLGELIFPASNPGDWK